VDRSRGNKPSPVDALAEMILALNPSKTKLNRPGSNRVTAPKSLIGTPEDRTLFQFWPLNILFNESKKMIWDQTEAQIIDSLHTTTLDPMWHLVSNATRQERLVDLALMSLFQTDIMEVAAERKKEYDELDDSVKNDPQVFASSFYDERTANLEAIERWKPDALDPNYPDRAFTNPLPPDLDKRMGKNWRRWGFRDQAELTNGRGAMMLFLILSLVETIFDKPVLQLFGLPFDPGAVLFDPD
jgi:hypothetical protein